MKSALIDVKQECVPSCFQRCGTNARSISNLMAHLFPASMVRGGAEKVRLVGRWMTDIANLKNNGEYLGDEDEGWKHYRTYRCPVQGMQHWKIK
jgi:hypothetical protein